MHQGGTMGRGFKIPFVRADPDLVAEDHHRRPHPRCCRPQVERQRQQKKKLAAIAGATLHPVFPIVVPIVHAALGQAVLVDDGSERLRKKCHGTEASSAYRVGASDGAEGLELGRKPTEWEEAARV